MNTLEISDEEAVIARKAIRKEMEVQYPESDEYKRLSSVLYKLEEL